MSWPKAFVRINGGLRTATVWGLEPRAHQIVDGKHVDIPMVAVTVEFPNGRPDDFDFSKQCRYGYLVLPLSDVCSINWECLQFFKRQVDLEWWRAWGVKCHVDGYGADAKAALLATEGSAESSAVP